MTTKIRKRGDPMHIPGSYLKYAASHYHPLNRKSEPPHNDAVIIFMTYIVHLSIEHQSPPRALRLRFAYYAANFEKKRGVVYLTHGSIKWYMHKEASHPIILAITIHCPKRPDYHRRTTR